MGRRVLNRAALLLAITAAGCYRPSVDACLYRCNGQACPNDLVCNNDKWCAAEKTDSCTDITGDGGGDDAPMPDASCGWNVANFDACQAQLHTLDATADWFIPGGMTVMIDTTSGSISPSSIFPTAGFKAVRSQLGTGALQVLVIGVHDLTIEGTINIVGDNPVIFAASGTARIGGATHFDATSLGGPGCNGSVGTGDGTDTLTAAGGGGGGSLGSSGGGGGMGGSNSGATGLGGGSPGALVAQPLIPLRMGCAGGRGGSWANPNQPGGVGGKGGGGIQFSARTLLTFMSGAIVTVNGEGGRSTSAVNSHGAGGGGGSGGALLLQAPMIDLDAARLCAIGGGGGGSQSGSFGGSTTTCPGTANGGGTGSVSSGGAGAAANPAGNGNPGKSGTPPVAEGGGGGGGGHGRIRTLGTVINTPATSYPPAMP